MARAGRRRLDGIYRLQDLLAKPQRQALPRSDYIDLRGDGYPPRNPSGKAPSFEGGEKLLLREAPGTACREVLDAMDSFGKRFVEGIRSDDAFD